MQQAGGPHINGPDINGPDINGPDIDGLHVDGPLIDDETGMRVFTVSQAGREAIFGIVPVDDEGMNGWLLRVGADIAAPTNPGFEPYETADEAYQAGLRAARAALESQS